MKTIRTRFMVLLSALFVVSAVYAGKPMVKVEGGWVREAPPGAMALAAYGKVINVSGKVLQLTGVECDEFGMGMIHETVVKDGMSSMHHHTGMMLTRGGKVEFKPGGMHIMLMKPKRKLKAGDEVVIRLQFMGGHEQAVTFPVEKK